MVYKALENVFGTLIFYSEIWEFELHDHKMVVNTKTSKKSLER